MLIARRIREATAADCAGMLLVLVLLRRRAAVQVHAGCAERLRMLLLGHARGAALLLLVRHAVGVQRGVRVSIVTAATAGPHSSVWLLLHAAASSSSQRCGSHAAATVLAHPAAAHLMVLGLQTPHSASVYLLLLAQHWCTHHPAAGASHRWCGAVIGLLLLLVQRVLAPHLLVVMVLLLVVVHVRRSVRGVRARRRIAAHNALVLHF